MSPTCGGPSLAHMQLIQIGVARQKTVLELVQEMAARQLQEIEQLKIAALRRAGTRRVRRSGFRCSSSHK